MKYFLYIIFILIVTSLGLGFYFQNQGDLMAERYIGGGIAGLFFVWMPLFIYHRWKNRSIQDYMLTKENIEQMNQYKQKK
jgi:hypothetical protein